MAHPRPDFFETKALIQHQIGEALSPSVPSDTISEIFPHGFHARARKFSGANNSPALAGHLIVVGRQTISTTALWIQSPGGATYSEHERNESRSTDCRVCDRKHHRWSEIVTHLNQNGLRTRRGGLWTPVGVKRVQQRWAGKI